MKTLEWCKENIGREQAWLILVKNGRVYRFAGTSIPNVGVIVTGSKQTTGDWGPVVYYYLLIADDVRVIRGFGELRDGLMWNSAASTPPGTWERVAQYLGVDDAEARRFARTEFPAEAAELDRVEAEARSLAATGGAS
jgi:hypothetical protein